MKKTKDLAPIAIPHGPPVESTEEYFKSLMEQARLVKKYPVWDVARPTPQVLVEQARRDLMDAGEKLDIKRKQESEFRKLMDEKWSDLRNKELLLKESFISFNKFIRENQEKRVRAEKKMKEDQETLLRRTQETEAMAQRVEEMEGVRDLMEKQVQDYSVYEDYLMSVVHKYPEFKQAMDVLNRYEALAAAKTTLAERQERDLEKLEDARLQIAHLTEEKKLFIMGLNNKLADLRRQYDKIRNRVVNWELVLSKLKETAARRHVELCHVRAAVRALYVRVSRQKGLPVTARADDYEAQLVVVMRALLELRRIHTIALNRAAKAQDHATNSKGLTNMTMLKSYEAGRSFAYLYQGSANFSTVLYFALPIIIHYVTKQPMETWYMVEVTGWINTAWVILRQLISQLILSFSFGQLSIFFGCNCILICGQLDLLCCSIRNARFTALLQAGVTHETLRKQQNNILLDELHNYSFNVSELIDSPFDNDKQLISEITSQVMNFDIYSSKLEQAMEAALKQCIIMSQNITEFVRRFESLVSPLLAARVVQVTLYLCTLLYAASRKLDIAIVEYLLAVVVDISVYCYFGNLVTTQSDRVSMATYQCDWVRTGRASRRLVSSMLLSHKRPLQLRAARFLTMDLATLLTIIKTSFSYYTLLVNIK